MLDPKNIHFRTSKTPMPPAVIALVNDLLLSSPAQQAFAQRFSWYPVYEEFADILRTIPIFIEDEATARQVGKNLPKIDDEEFDIDREDEKDMEDPDKMPNPEEVPDMPKIPVVELLGWYSAYDTYPDGTKGSSISLCLDAMLSLRCKDRHLVIAKVFIHELAHAYMCSRRDEAYQQNTKILHGEPHLVSGVVGETLLPMRTMDYGGKSYSTGTFGLWMEESLANMMVLHVFGRHCAWLNAQSGTPQYHNERQLRLTRQFINGQSAPYRVAQFLQFFVEFPVVWQQWRAYKAGISVLTRSQRTHAEIEWYDTVRKKGFLMPEESKRLYEAILL